MVWSQDETCPLTANSFLFQLSLSTALGGDLIGASPNCVNSDSVID